MDLSDCSLGRKEKSLEKFVMSPDHKWIVFFGNDGYLILVSARTKQVRYARKYTWPWFSLADCLVCVVGCQLEDEWQCAARCVHTG